ncbi:MAG: hypothetical protein E7F76_02795 [Actinomyces sp.]|nr:hypothetical protein [Actinomyces sp.]
MSQDIEWHPEYVAQAAKKADDAGESATKHDSHLSQLLAAARKYSIH